MNSDLLQSSNSFGARLRLRSTQYAVAGIVLGLVFPAIAAAIEVTELGLPVTVLNMLAVQRIEPVLWITDTAPLFLGLLAGLAGRREDLVLQANDQLRQREGELSSTRAHLEEIVSERTRQLDERNSEMRSVVFFARQVADIQDISTLLPASVRMISERFAGLHANLFLLDESGQSVVLKASSSPAGQELLKAGHRVAVGDQSAVGRVARRGKLLISPLRPESLDEIGRNAGSPGSVADIALPLMVRGKVIGVLDVQSQAKQALGENEAETLQLLADLLAASIENARLVSESRAAVDQLEVLSSEATRAVWSQYLKGSRFAYQFTPAGTRSINPVTGDGQARGTRIPLILRGQEIGSIALSRSTGEHWTPTEQDLMEKLAAQIALALENARLIEETRQRATQEQVVSEISARFSRSLDVEALLQAAAREFAALPDVAEAAVVLKPIAGQGS